MKRRPMIRTTMNVIEQLDFIPEECKFEELVQPIIPGLRFPHEIVNVKKLGSSLFIRYKPFKEIETELEDGYIMPQRYHNALNIFPDLTDWIISHDIWNYIPNEWKGVVLGDQY